MGGGGLQDNGGARERNFSWLLVMSRVKSYEPASERNKRVTQAALLPLGVEAAGGSPKQLQQPQPQPTNTNNVSNAVTLQVFSLAFFFFQ